MRTSKRLFGQPGRGALALSLAAAVSVMVAGCGGEGSAPPTSEAPEGTPKLALFAFYSTDEGDHVARINLDTLQIEETAPVGVRSSGGKQKSWFYEGPVWVGGGGNVWGIDPNTLEAIPRQHSPSIQGNREGDVAQAMVNSSSMSASSGVGGASTTTLSPELKALLSQTSYTDEQLAQYDICTLSKAHYAQVTGSLSAAGGTLSMQTIEPAEIFHNTGYSPVGIEPAPDGKLTMFGVRQGDHILFLDTDPDSDTFGQAVRFVYPRYGFVKDGTNSVVGTFDSKYTAGTTGGTAPGNLRYNRLSSGTTETDKATYIEPCDSTMLRAADGTVWSWTVDVDGDTITGVRVDTLTGDNPEVYQHVTPRVRQNNVVQQTHADGGVATPGSRVGPWMGSLVNRNAGDNELLLFVETEAENTEMVWNVTDAENAYEVQRMIIDLADVVPGTFENGNVYSVDVNFSGTGGPTEAVDYEYVALAGDNGTGRSTHVTTAYLAKVDDADPGPQYIVNGLRGRAFTSIGNLARLQGSGPATTVFSDEVWLTTTQGADGFQIVDLRNGPPFLVTHTMDHPSSGWGAHSPDGKWYFQARGGNVEVINTTTRSLAQFISAPGSITALAMGTYSSTDDAPTPAPGGGGNGGGGGGEVLPPNPCGG